MIINWKLWLRRCKAKMEDKQESGEAVRIGVKYWLAKVVDGMTGFSSVKATKILEELRLTPIVNDD